MLHREFQSRYYRKRKPPTAAQTRHWLTFLAQQLKRESQTEFLIERIQHSWLTTSRQKRIFKLSTMLAFGPFFGVLFGLFSGLRMGMFVGLFFTLCFGIISILNGVEMDKDEEVVNLVETISWSLKKAEKEFLDELFFALLIGLPLGVFLGFASGSFFGVIFGIFTGLFHALCKALPRGLIFSEAEIKRIPNQGIQKSVANALLAALFFGLITGAIAIAWFSGLISGEIPSNSRVSKELFWKLNLGSGIGLNIGLFYGLGIVGARVGLFFALWAGLFFGGGAGLHHLVLRFILFCSDSIPWNYARFLNYCTERLLLQRVGGRYRFVHKLLQEWFAEMDGRWGEMERRSEVLGGE